MKAIKNLNDAQKKNLVNELLAPWLEMAQSLGEDENGSIMESARDEVKSMGLGQYL